jgi:hypothetical protein
MHIFCNEGVISYTIFINIFELLLCLRLTVNSEKQLGLKPVDRTKQESSLKYIVYFKYLSRVTTKPTYWVCDQHGSSPACASTQSDQDPCCMLTNPITSRETDSEQHESWSDCTDALAGLDPCWSQTHYDDFVVTWLIWW